MRPDKFSLAKAWINDERSTPEEARATWNAMDQEFNENRKIFLASAESDALKDAINKKFGPGTIKYGSEIPQPPARPDVIEIDAINAFIRRNPAAEGGRIGFGRGLKVLDKTEKKNVLNWGKNVSGGEWSSEKTFKEYDKASRDRRMKIRSGVTTGAGDPGFKKKGDVKPLTKEQQKLWNATMADKVGKWEDYGTVNRGNWLKNIDEKLDKFRQTKNLLNREELGNFLTKNLGVEFDKYKIFGRRSGLISGEKKTAFGKYVDDKLFEIEFGDGQQKYYKKPTDAQIKFIKENLLQDVRKNSLNTNTLNTIKKIDKLYGSIYKSGNLPDLKSMMKRLNLTGNQIAYAEAQLARIYGGHKFKNHPEGIRVNNKTANSMFDIIAQSEFGNPRKNQVYEMSLELIDEGLGNEKGTFRDLKNKALQILNENKIDVYDSKKGKKAFGFNIDEFAGVTGSGKSANMGVSQFINIMEGNLNTKELQSFQGGLSKARAAVEAAKGTSRYNSVLKDQMQKINTRAANLENKFGIKLARLERPADINNMSANEVKRLKNIKLGTGENLYQRLVKDAKASGYSIKVPKGSLTIQEFTDPTNERARELIALVGCPDFKGKQVFAEGGRTGFAEGGDCFDKGQKLINNGMKGASPASMRNAAKFLNSAYKFGRNVMKFGIIPEAIFVTGETLLRSLGDQTLEEGLKSSIGFYTDWTGLTDFKSDARISQNMRNMGVDATMNIERLVKFNDATDKVNKLKQMKESDLAVNDESLTGLTDQEVAANADKNIKAAQINLDNKFLKESEKLYFSQQQDEAADIAGTKSPFQKAYAAAKNKTENLRSDGSIIDLNDLSGMQSDMFMIDPMSAKAKKDSVKNLPPRSPLTGSKGETAFLNLSQLPMGPRMGSEIDVLAKAMNENFKLQGSDQRTDAAYLKAMQDYKNNYKNMTMEEMLAIGIPREAIYGFNQPEVIKEKPVYDFSEGGITGLRSKYEYKK